MLKISKVKILGKKTLKKTPVISRKDVLFYIINGTILIQWLKKKVQWILYGERVEIKARPAPEAVLSTVIVTRRVCEVL